MTANTKYILQLVAQTELAKGMSEKIPEMKGFFDFFRKQANPKDSAIIEGYLAIKSAEIDEQMRLAEADMKKPPEPSSH